MKIYSQAHLFCACCSCTLELVASLFGYSTKFLAEFPDTKDGKSVCWMAQTIMTIERGEINMTRDEKKIEAIARMKKAGIFPQTIKQFEEDGYVSISEPPVGAFFWAEGEDLQRIRDFEEKHNALVYLVIRSYTDFGKMDCYLYVSDYPEEWPQDREDLANSEPMAYVYNHDMPDCSEFGCIGTRRSIAAGLLRTW